MATTVQPIGTTRIAPSRKMNPRSRPIEVLLVEDNPADVRLTKEAFLEGRIANHLNVVHDGVEAVEYLQRRGQFRDATRPDLILLDLNLPRKSGREVLEEIKAEIKTTQEDILRLLAEVAG